MKESQNPMDENNHHPVIINPTVSVGLAFFLSGLRTEESPSTWNERILATLSLVFYIALAIFLVWQYNTHSKEANNVPSERSYQHVSPAPATERKK